MYDPLDGHKKKGCSWYCRDGLHAVGVMSKNEETARLEHVRSDVWVITNGMLEVVSVRYAPESRYDIYDGSWTVADEKFDYPCIAMVRYTKRWYDYLVSSTEADTVGV